MPGYTIHMAIAKEYMKKHPGKIKDPAKFLRGVMMPDRIKPKAGSHYGIDSSHPGLNLYLDTQDVTNDEKLGYFIHLLTDYYFYQKYMTSIEWSSDIYEDYNKLNQELIDQYELDIPEEIKDVVKFSDGPLKLLDRETLKQFIAKVGNLDLEELMMSRDFDGAYEREGQENEAFLDFNELLKVRFIQRRRGRGI